MALLSNVNSGAVLACVRARLPFASMRDVRKAKVTAENLREAKQLRKLWEERSHPSQAEFGETYGIGNQSAVGQFLRGELPLSFNAARGFAKGLGCTVRDFSPRIADAIDDLISVNWPFGDILSLTEWSELPGSVKGKIRAAVELFVVEHRRQSGKSSDSSPGEGRKSA